MSIQSHSKSSNKLVIFSVYNWKIRQITSSRGRHHSVKHYLDSNYIDYKEIRGCYKGKREESFILDYRHLGIVLELAWDADQESILILDAIGAHGTRKAHLKYLDGRPTETIGWLRESTRGAAIAMQDYSYNPITDKYYIVEQDYTKAGQIQ